MRNRHGRYVYALTELPMGYPGGDGASVLDADVGETLAFGADLRTVWLQQWPGAPTSTDEASESGHTHGGAVGQDDISTFIPMQGDVYFALTAFDGLSLYFDQGVHGSFEATAMYGHEVGGPNFQAYLRAGHFMPSYGLRIANHNTFTRQEIGFGPRDKDTGVELGLQLGPVLLQGAVLSGTASSAFTDDNREKAFVGRAEALVRIGAFRLLFGSSIYSNQTGSVVTLAEETLDTREDDLRLGMHWGAGLGRFSYLGEADLIDVNPFEANEDGTRVHSFRSYQELDVRIVRGLELLLNYEYRQPDLDLKSGLAHRLAAGFSLVPIPSLEILALYRRTIGTGRDEEVNDGFQELIGMIHAYF